MTLDDLSRLLEAHEKLYHACMWIDHGHPPLSIRPELAEVQRVKAEIYSRSGEDKGRNG